MQTFVEFRMMELSAGWHIPCVTYIVTVSNGATLDLTGGGGMNIGPFASAADGAIVIAPEGSC